MHLQKQQSEWRDALCYLPEPGPIITWMYLQLVREIPTEGFVITLHGTEVKQFCSLFHRRILFRRLLGSAHRVGVVSNYVKGLLLAEFPELEPKTVLAPGAPRVDINPALPREHDRSTSAPTILLTVARIHPRKGQLAVLEALSRLPMEKRSRIEYRMAGPATRPAYLRKLRRFARAKGVALRYLGSLDVDGLAEAYGESDIFVMASVSYRRSVEGLGLGYLEASAHGLPVIAHRIGGVEDAVKAGESGILVDPDDRDGLARAITELVDGGELRRSLGESGRRWAKRFSWDATARRLFEDLV
jgi:glycosyltransferase involved in cell wall biosynthesis